MWGKVRALAVLVTVLLFSVSLAPSFAQVAETTCTTLHAQMRGLQLTLTDLQTGQAVHTEALPYPFAIEHSPDCRFLIGHSTDMWDCDPGLIIWNATSGERMQQFEGFCDKGHTVFPRVIWKPDLSAALITEWYRLEMSTARILSFGVGTPYLWYPDTNQLVRLEVEQYPASNDITPTLFQVEWDDARGWVWSSGLGGIAAFDMQTGALMAEFENTPILSYYSNYPSTFFTFSPDRTRVVTHSQRSVDLRLSPAITVYDIASGAGVQVNPETNGAGDVAMSTDNRYLAMRYTAVRVWDLHNLPERVEDRLPIYRLPLPADFDGRVYFADATRLIVEAASGEVVFIYDMNTGQRIEG